MYSKYTTNTVHDMHMVGLYTISVVKCFINADKIAIITKSLKFAKISTVYNIVTIRYTEVSSVDHEIYRKKQQPVYKATDQVAFYEDVSKLDVGGPLTAIELSECPAYAPTESGGGQRREEDRIYDN